MTVLIVVVNALLNGQRGGEHAGPDTWSVFRFSIPLNLKFPPPPGKELPFVFSSDLARYLLLVSLLLFLRSNGFARVPVYRVNLLLIRIDVFYKVSPKRLFTVTIILS